MNRQQNTNQSINQSINVFISGGETQITQQDRKKTEMKYNI